ncbi:hypothetical protein MSPP1_000323 [Malassezia sp. CBS 17886]|nr:hypothetical protein MSPP1_000323 [Malassezia sp. CBS 17886]
MSLGVLIEDVVSGMETPNASLAPSAVAERDDLGSLLYLFDDENEEFDDEENLELDEYLENELLVNAMGQRLLAVSGHDIDDSVLSMAQFFLGSPSSSRALSDAYGDAYGAYGPSHDLLDDLYVNARYGDSVMRFPPPPRLRDLDVRERATTASGARRFRVLPGGYLTPDPATAAGQTRLQQAVAADDDGSGDEDSYVLAGDEAFLQRLGAQLLYSKSGAPCWVIESVRGSGDHDVDTDKYIIAEASTSSPGLVSPR